TPHAAIMVLGVWAIALIVGATLLREGHPERPAIYELLITYVIFGTWLFYGMTTAALIVLRVRRPEAHRPYRAWGYPVLPALFVLVAVGFLANTLATKPREALYGLGMVALGVPAFWAWNRQKR